MCLNFEAEQRGAIGVATTWGFLQELGEGDTLNEGSGETGQGNGVVPRPQYHTPSPCARPPAWWKRLLVSRLHGACFLARPCHTAAKPTCCGTAFLSVLVTRPSGPSPGMSLLVAPCLRFCGIVRPHCSPCRGDALQPPLASTRGIVFLLLT